MERTQLKNKLSFFQFLLYSKSYDILSVSETWQSSHTLDGEILPTGYTIYRQDREGRGGGVLVAVSNLIPSTRVHVSSTSELLVIHLATNPTTDICCAYIPPTSSAPDYDNIFLPLHSIPHSAHLILLGDFNITDVNWSTLSAYLQHPPSQFVSVFSP